MTLTLKRNDKPRKGNRTIVFDVDGRKTSIGFPKSLFGDAVPDELLIDGAFAAPPVPKVRETPEARKARLAALPKLTLAEKVARREEALAKLKAKLAASAPQ